MSLPLFPPAPAPVDVLRWPLIGRFLRWRHARTAWQTCLLVAAVAVVLHGLLGPDLAPKNLATLGVWVHYRGLLVLGILAVGNVFCAGCPFVLVRDLGRRLRPPTWRWPRWLRAKWLGLAGLVGILFAYELLDLWARPRETALLVLAYFGAALAIDLAFKGAVFCKHICPVGQFNFVASTLSPLEIAVKDGAVCERCSGHECIKGVAAPQEAPARPLQRGCELGLFLPRKVGNLDCTLCLDCVRACPYENVALRPRVPGVELAIAAKRSGIGRLAKRRDLAALSVVFAFGGLVNAFGMVGPVYDLQRWLGAAIGVQHEAPVLGLIFLLGLVALPALVVGVASASTRALAGPVAGKGSIADRFAFCLVPVGLGVWLSHYGFHLLTGGLTLVPLIQGAAADLFGWQVLGVPLWHLSGLQPGAVFPIELGFLLLGATGSIIVARAIAGRDYPARAGRAALSWCLVIVAVAGAAAWILSQPMEMRGTEMGGF